MNGRLLIVLYGAAVTGCSHSHVFEVPADSAQEASLTLCNETTAMERAGPIFVGRRRGGDGSGRIEIVYGDGRRVVCPIGYVTSREPEPHRIAMADGECREL